MESSVVLPLLSAVVSFLFAALVFDQWLRRRRSYQLVWTLGLTWYGIGAGTEFLGGAFGWNEPLYRAWYLFGAFSVAAYLGLGTIFLLNRTRFGYFVAFSLFAGGLFSALSALARAREGEPVGSAVVALVVAIATTGAALLAAVTWRDRRRVAPTAALILAIGSVAVTVLTLTARVDAPGYALDPVSGVPIGEAFPSYLRILSPLFNITGAFALVFGALFSAYIFMPKRRVLRATSAAPLVGPLMRGGAVIVNFVASIPGAVAAWRAGRLHSRVPATLLIALGGFVPGWTDGLSRFGITWGFFLGQFIGVVLIFAGFLASIEVFSDLRIPFTGVIIVRRRPAGAEGTSPGHG